MTSFLYQHRLALAATVLVVCILLAVYAWSQLYLAARDRWRSRTERKARAAQAATPAVQETGPEAVAPAAPVVHEGADEQYGAEIRAAGQALPSADLIRPAEQMVADHLELDVIGRAIAEMSERIAVALAKFEAGGKVDPRDGIRVSRWGQSTIADTGEYPIVKTEAALASAGVR